jgi:hypothetical protein
MPALTWHPDARWMTFSLSSSRIVIVIRSVTAIEVSSAGKTAAG